MLGNTRRWPHLHLHGVRVNLAHVLAAVFAIHVTNVQRPSIVIVVRNRESCVIRDHVLVYRQNRFRVRFNPSYLFTDTRANKICQLAVRFGKLFAAMPYLIGRVLFIRKNRIVRRAPRRI